MQKKFVVKASRAFLRELDKLPPDSALAIAKKLKILEFAPLPVGKSEIKKIKGYIPPLYRLRLGVWRVLYRISGNEVIVLRIIGRKELERELKKML